MSSPIFFNKDFFSIFKDQYPEVTLEQINLPSSGDGGGGAVDFSGGASTYGGASASSSSNASTAQPMQLGLNQGTLHDVFVSHIVSGGTISSRM